MSSAVSISIKPGASIKRKELLRRYGGRRQGGISPSRKSPNVFLFMDKRRGMENGYIYDGKHHDGTLHYTGEGRFGEQKMEQGNRAIRDHREEGRALHVFDVHKGSATYLGEFTYVDHYDADAPPSGGGTYRKVLVFILRRTRGTVPLPKAAVDLRDSGIWTKKVGVERHLKKDEIPISPKPYKAQRREQGLVKDLEDWLTAAGHSICSLELHGEGEASTIRCDLFDETDNAIIEAKSSIARPAFRMAIGQIADYSRLMNPPPNRRLILVPEQPRSDLIALAKSQKIGVIWPDGEGGFASEG